MTTDTEFLFGGTPDSRLVVGCMRLVAGCAMHFPISQDRIIVRESHASFGADVNGVTGGAFIVLMTTEA